MSIQLTKPLVSFVVAGTQKGGTTALHKMLEHHPDVCLPKAKEMHFFDSPKPRFLDPLRALSYHRRFDPKPGQTVGEMTPIYMYWDGALERAKAYNPAMKIIMILRNPIERAHSHWKMETNRGDETLPFGEAVRTEAARLESAPNGQNRHYSYCARGHYAGQVKRAYELFGEEQVLLVRYDDYIERPEQEIARVLRFIGVRDDVELPEVRAHASGRTAMDEADKAYLVDHFRPHVEELAQLTGWDLQNWLQ